MNRQNRAILYGMLIGDGNLYQATNNFGTKYVKLTIGHSPKQEKYLSHKIDLIHSIFGGKKPKIYTYKSKGYTNLQTVKTDKYLNQCKNILYPNGVKKITKQVLEYLDDQGLALWFMDDGSGNRVKNKLGKVCGATIKIATYCSEEEAISIREWFRDKYNLDARFDIDKRNNRYSIRFNTSDAHKFCLIVKPYIIESMSYKIDIAQERETT